jgi:hypothetical protein
MLPPVSQIILSMHAVSLSAATCPRHIKSPLITSFRLVPAPLVATPLGLRGGLVAMLGVRVIALSIIAVPGTTVLATIVSSLPMAFCTLMHFLARLRHRRHFPTWCRCYSD